MKNTKNVVKKNSERKIDQLRLKVIQTQLPNLSWK